MNGIQTSVIIPSRSDQYLQQTVNELLNKSEKPIEVIVIYDGIWPEEELDADSRVVIMHHGTIHNNPGMRFSINAGMNMARGKYVMKIDEHCMLDEGWDKKLAEHCDANWVVIPRRKRLNAEKWELEIDRRPDIDYMYVEYPYLKPYDKTQGLHGAEWKRPERAEIMVDDNPTMQGSCYFMHKKYWDELFPKGLDDHNYGPFTQEAQEVSMSAWLSGGRVIVNKHTWYAHWHKGSKGKGYGFSREQYKKHMEWTEQGRVYCINHWLYTKDYKHDFDWFINEKFPDMPGGS